eukprot:scaffold94575_cov21-Tisochrysis_lutea.AAC.1
MDLQGYSVHFVRSETVVEAALGVFAAIASCPGQFRPVLGELLGRFRGDTGALLLQVGEQACMAAQPARCMLSCWAGSGATRGRCCSSWVCGLACTAGRSVKSKLANVHCKESCLAG